MSDHLTIEVYRTHATGAVAVQIVQRNRYGIGSGYRLAGPEHHNLGSTTLLTSELDKRDATEIRERLDAVFPLTDNEVRGAALTEAIKTVIEARRGADAAELPGLRRALKELHALRGADESSTTTA